MKLIKKLYGGLDLTWPQLIGFAVAIGVVVGGIMLTPVDSHYSLKDIGTNFEWWIFFGTVIVANSKSPVDSAAKAFVFFLISQPLIYLVQVPFSDMGWDLFGYYKNWILWTLATIPMGAVGHFVRRGDLISSIILSAMTAFLATHMIGYIESAVSDFPHHLVSAVLCAVFIVLPIIGITSTKASKIAAWGLAAAIVTVFAIILVLRGGAKKFTQTFNADYYGMNINSTSEAVVTVNLQCKSIHQFDGTYYVDIEMDQGDEGRLTILTDGVETTYKITYDKETNSPVVEKLS